MAMRRKYRRTKVSAAESAELWERWKKDEGLHAIGQATQKRGAKGTIVDAVSISERPPSIEDRAVPGHWEGDLLCGAKNSYIVTLVERHSRYVMLAKVKSRHTQTVISALIRQARKLPDKLCKSLTWDRGPELADHTRFTMATDIDVYFCDPQSPWQRGSNENTTVMVWQDRSAFEKRAIESTRRPRASRLKRTFSTTCQQRHRDSRPRPLATSLRSQPACARLDRLPG